MHILITGAGGFIGRHLARRLLERPDGVAPDRLTLVDQAFPHPVPTGAGACRVTCLEGSFADPALLARALPADLVFHLASVPSGLAERDYAQGMRVNVDGLRLLLDGLAGQPLPPALVFASSIAVFGKPATERVDDDTCPTPNLSYGAQKVVGETLVADHHRRQSLRGCSVRLPGIVARPPQPNGAVSIFFSDLIRQLAAGEPFTCPVSASARAWLMSVQCCVDNLLQAGRLALSAQDRERVTWTLPALHVSIGDLVDALAARCPDHDVRRLVSYAPDAWVEDNFGSYPPLHCPRAEAAGFRHDGSLATLIVRSGAG